MIFFIVGVSIVLAILIVVTGCLAVFVWRRLNSAQNHLQDIEKHLADVKRQLKQLQDPRGDHWKA